MSEQLISQLFGAAHLPIDVKLGSQVMNLYGCFFLFAFACVNVGHFKVEA